MGGNLTRGGQALSSAKRRSKRAARCCICYSGIKKEPCVMHISSPFVVVPVLIAVFVASILFATSSKEDKHSE